MAIDEFGREVPGGTRGSSSVTSGNGADSPGHGNGNSNNYEERSRSSSYHRNGGGGSSGRGGGGGEVGNMRYGDMGRRSHSPAPPAYDGGRGRTASADNDDRYHRRSHSRDSRSPPHFSSNSRSSHHGHHHQQQRGRSGSPQIISRRGRSRSFSPHYNDSGRGGRDRGNRTRNLNPHRHPVEEYVDNPMLCETLWAEENAKQNFDQNVDSVQKTRDSKDVGDDDDGPLRPNASNDETEKPVSEDSQKKESDTPTTYESYKKEYCLDYVRGFFNAHLDDEWFKLRYSPLHRKALASQKRDRAAAEASAIKDEISKLEAGELFISDARLGIGKKPTAGEDSSSRRTIGGSTKRKYSNADNDDDGGSSKYRNPVPSSHMLSGHARCALEITDVPPFVTDSQLSHALAEHSSSPPLRICSTTVGLSQSGDGRPSPKFCNSLMRTVWAIFINEEAKEEMVENVTKANFDANRILDRDRSMAAGIIPSIDASKNGKSALELDVECSDTFGRSEIDADGKGGAPTPIVSDLDDMSVSVKERSTVTPKVANRKVTVFVRTDSWPQSISVLSAAVSSKNRIPRDKTAAFMIARALDTASSIPNGVQLDDLVEFLFSSEKEHADEDVLDVAIAYLRRVHLFSFYNCRTASSEGDVLSGNHSAGIIYLRLRDADEILRKANEQDETSEVVNGDRDSDESLATDMLVKRLDVSIAKSLEECTAKIGNTNILVNEEVDAQAAEVEKGEILAKQKWLDDHALLDTDGRARCSFHFCRKLFKDTKFLNKHLLKKHPEYLAGEQAKTHDTYMMKAWEGEEIRPIPQILVDCDRFGLVPVNVYGSTCPIAPDPAPELFRKEEESTARRREEEERRERYQQRSNSKMYDAQPNETRNDQRPGNSGSGGTSGFVDVDDMKDEKVELSFENVALPIPPPKKKKKKKKIL